MLFEPSSLADITRIVAEAVRSSLGGLEISESRRRYREAAAVLSSFDAEQLQPVGEPGSFGAAFALVAEDSALTGEPGKFQWSLKTNARRETLRDLAGNGRLRAVLEANPNRPRDTRQRALDAYVLGQAWPLDTLTSAQLNDTLEVVGWLKDLVPGLPSTLEVRRRRDLASLLEPLRERAREPFVGRDGELQRLTEYVDRPPTTSLYLVPPLFVYGPGGVGKSALLTRLVLAYVGRDAATRPLFAHLDLQKPGALDDDPITLLIQAAGQLAIQAPEAASSWESLLGRWAEVLVRGGCDAQQDGRRSPTVSERQQLLVEFQRAFGSGERRVLVGLDNFDDALYRGDPFVRELWHLLNELQGLCPSIRWLIAGQVKPAGVPFEGFELVGLRRHDAEDFLASLGITDAEAVRAIVSRANGSPLRLLLAAAILERSGLRAVAFEGPKDAVDAFLYRQLLAGVQDPGLRRLALCSFVPRHVSVEILREVLAEPAGVSLGEGGDDVRLFRELQRVLRFSTATTDDVSHPQEIRRAMVELLRHADPERTRAVHAAAVDYYRRQTRRDARTEELYHRLCLGEQPKGVAKELWQALRPSMPDLPPAGQTYLAEALGLGLSDEVLARGKLERWEQTTERGAREALRRNDAAAALELLREREERTPGSALFLLELRSQVQLGDLAGARAVLEGAFTSTAPMGDCPLLVDLLAADADLLTRAGRLQEARQRLEDGRAVARRIESAERLVELGLQRLYLDRLLDLPADAPLEEDIRSEVLGLTAASSRQRPELLQGVVAAVGARYPDIVMQAARLEVLLLPPPDHLDALVALLTSVGGNVVRPVDGAALGRAVVGFIDAHPSPEQFERLTALLAAGLSARSLSPGAAGAVRLSPRVIVLRTYRADLRAALSHAYDRNGLEELLDYNMDVKLEHLTPPADLLETFRRVLDWADRTGRLEELFDHALRNRATNPDLSAFVAAHPELGGPAAQH